jgi:hypothetical protein
VAVDVLLVTGLSVGPMGTLRHGMWPNCGSHSEHRLVCAEITFNRMRMSGKLEKEQPQDIIAFVLLLSSDFPFTPPTRHHHQPRAGH